MGKTKDGKTDLNKRGRTIELPYGMINISLEEIEHAQGVVAANAVDAQDAHELLEALGIMPNQSDWYRTPESE